MFGETCEHRIACFETLCPRPELSAFRPKFLDETTAEFDVGLAGGIRLSGPIRYMHHMQRNGVEFRGVLKL